MSHALKDRLVVALCANYIYTGVLEEVTPDRVVLGNPSIIYETGDWTATNWKDAQRLPTNRVYIERTSVESLFEIVRGAGK